MNTPHFYDEIPTITLHDPLAQLLGAADQGILTYSYEDMVKLAGHSCPTVAGAYLMILMGLKTLYENETPIRGEIRVLLKGRLGDGVVGVVANVASMITGATDTSGFHGLGGRFDRRHLLQFDAKIDGEFALERVDTGARVEMNYNPSIVANDPKMAEILPLILHGDADAQTQNEFASLWQERVKRILLEYRDDPRLIQCIY